MALALTGALGFGAGFGYSVGRASQGEHEPARPHLASMPMTRNEATTVPPSSRPTVAAQVREVPEPVSRPVVGRQVRPKSAKGHKLQHRSVAHMVRKHRKAQRTPCARFESFRARVCRTLFKGR